MEKHTIDDFINLKNDFKRIQEMGFVKGINNNKNASGATFENLINSTSGDICIPDYGSIEIKTLRPYKLASINLFSSAPDGKYEKANQWLAENFGYKDKSSSDLLTKNELICTFSGDYMNTTKSGYKFIAHIDYIRCKIFIYIYDKNKKLISKNDIYWDFDTIADKLNRKLSYMALIDVNKKIIEGDNYYAYTKMKIYKLKSISTFLKLLETGVIKINIKVGVYKTGIKKGCYNDHGSSFSILRKDISKLYNELYYL